jgi:hypothetical protein
MMTLCLSVACGGREGDDTANAPGPRTKPSDSGAPASANARPDSQLFSEREAANLQNLVAQRRKNGTRQPQFTRITPESGEDAIELPEAFPVDIPLPSQASPTSYVSSETDGTMTIAVVDDSPDGAFSFYLHELEAEGWYVENSGAASDLMMVNATKGNRMLAVAITDLDGTTKITLIESGTE